jgi:hypothetical protein
MEAVEAMEGGVEVAAVAEVVVEALEVEEVMVEAAGMEAVAEVRFSVTTLRHQTPNSPLLTPKAALSLSPLEFNRLELQFTRNL